MSDRDLTLAEELLLLALDDARGSIHGGVIMSLDFGLAGALLMELTLHGRLTLVDERIVVVDASPLGQPILDDALRAIEISKKPRKAQDWVTRLSKEVGGLRERLLSQLVERGVLERREDKILRIFRVTRYPEQQGHVEDAIRARIDAALLAGVAPDERTGLLIQLVLSCRLLDVLYAKPQRKAAKARAEELAAQSAYGEAVDAAISGAQAAVNAAIISSTIAATTAATTAACTSTTAASCS